jgi:hypothetical protein
LLARLVFVKVAQGLFCQHELTLVWIKLDWPAQNYVALLKVRDVRTFNEAGLDLEFIKQVIPQVMLGQDPSVAKDDETVLGSCECHIQSSWIIEETNA